MSSAVWVALGGALGSLARYFATIAVTAILGSEFPWGTVVVNITGCALIGALVGAGALMAKVASESVVRDFLIVGLCGGYPTFSSFSLQTLTLLQAGQSARAMANVIASVVLCLLATWAGYTLARAVA